MAVLLVASFVKDLSGVTRFTTARPVERDLMAGDERMIYSGRNARGGSFRPEPACEVTDMVSGQPVELSPETSIMLTLGEAEFDSVASFEVPHDGRFRVSCSADSAQPVELAVGPRIRIFRSISRFFAAGAAGLAALGVAVAIVAVTAVKRHEARRQSRAQPRA